jgi:hypothetical protein
MEKKKIFDFEKDDKEGLKKGWTTRIEEQTKGELKIEKNIGQTLVEGNKTQEEERTERIKHLLKIKAERVFFISNLKL